MILLRWRSLLVSASPSTLSETLELPSFSSEMERPRYVSLSILTVLLAIAYLYYTTLFIVIDGWLSLQTAAGLANAIVFSFLTLMSVATYGMTVYRDPGRVPLSFIPDIEDPENPIQEIMRKGCDGSMLIYSTKDNTVEKDSPVNLSLRGYEIIDQAKQAIEDQCPGTVSCADILTMAARDAVFWIGGPLFDMPKGRLDGRRSKIEDTSTSQHPSLIAQPSSRCLVNMDSMFRSWWP